MGGVGGEGVTEGVGLVAGADVRLDGLAADAAAGLDPVEAVGQPEDIFCVSRGRTAEVGRHADFAGRRNG